MKETIVFIFCRQYLATPLIRDEHSMGESTHSFHGRDRETKMLDLLRK